MLKFKRTVYYSRYLIYLQNSIDVYCIVLSCLCIPGSYLVLPISKIMPKTLHRSKSKIRLPPHLFFLFQSCLYTNKYELLYVFYMILFVHFYIKKYNSVPFYFIASKFNKMSKLKKDIKYNGTLLYFLM